MLPVTRANLDHICCICLLDVRPSMFTKKVYDVKKETNMSKVLKLSALITILKNPMNQKYIKDYCRKICEICLVKTQYFYSFREKIMSSTAMLKELLETNELNEQDIERLQFFCRICSNRLKSTKDLKYLNMTHLKWLKDCSGIRFTSLIDTGKFRIKEGTNINEIALINDTNFPQKICSNCFKKLQNVEEFRKSATKSFEYMISVMGDASLPEDYLVTQQLKQYNENMIFRKEPQTQPVLVTTNCAKQDCAISEMNSFEYQKVQALSCLDDECIQDQEYSSYNFEYQKEQKLSHSDAEYTMDKRCSDRESVKNTSNYASTQKLEYDTFENVMELMDDLAHYSNDSEDVSLNLNEFADFGADKNKCLRKTRATKLKQCNINNEGNSNSEAEAENAFKPKHRCKKIQKQLEESKRSCNRQNLSSNVKKLKKTDKVSHDDSVKKTENDHACVICFKIFATRSKCKKHQRTVHRTRNHECLVCLKKFKRKSLLTDHIKAVHEKLRPFNCSYCPKTFSAKSSRRVHELTHTGDYPFVCKSCGKGFRQSSQLKIHSEIHTTNPELLCPICKRSQKSQNDLENHLQSHKDKRLQCPLCGKFFTRSHHLKDHHNAVHLKLRPFKCEFCELAFGDRKTRLSHEKSHKEDRPLTCSVCKSGFKTLFSLSRHINRFGHQTEDNQSKIKTKKQKSVKSISPYYTEKNYNSFEL